ncbi:hypothetical protein F5050DRAFT_1812043 [Lentinula boryana]|uniref:Uncharacterized protein n=1 Tax=Lentinula boryana TaxID=40481 RepID=A0ABQ8PZJ6_9AGAR|nr:hypothetical protein F5050DRAFT_1812043 [Lentinula boryana]
MVNTRSRHARTTTEDSDNIQEDPVMANPFATNATAFVPFAEVISRMGLPQSYISIPAEVPEEPEIVEPIKEVSPDLPGHPEDLDPEGSDPEGPPGGPGGPGGPDSPWSSRAPSHCRSPPAQLSSNCSDIAEQRIIELFTTFRGTLDNQDRKV